MNRWLVRLCGAVFLASVAGKLKGPCGFASTVSAWFHGGTYAAVLCVVAVEAGLGVQLLWGTPRRLAVQFAALVLAGFTLFLVVGIGREGLTFRCSCLGALGLDHPIVGLARNATMLSILVASLALSHSKRSGRRGGASHA